MASFAQQYGIRLFHEDLPYPEYRSLLTGISPDTPLGKIVAIRAERDPKAVQQMTPDQRRIRSEWIAKQTAKTPVEQQMDEVRAFQTIFKSAFGKKKGAKK